MVGKSDLVSVLGNVCCSLDKTEAVTELSIHFSLRFQSACFTRGCECFYMLPWTEHWFKMFFSKYAAASLQPH